MDYLSHLQENEDEVSRKRAGFVSEYRNRLCRIPLEHRMAGERKASFILNQNMPSQFLARGIAKNNSQAAPERKKRTVSEWAQKKNITFEQILHNIYSSKQQNASKKKVWMII